MHGRVVVGRDACVFAFFTISTSRSLCGWLDVAISAFPHCKMGTRGGVLKMVWWCACSVEFEIDAEVRSLLLLAADRHTKTHTHARAHTHTQTHTHTHTHTQIPPHPVFPRVSRIPSSRSQICRSHSHNIYKLRHHARSPPLWPSIPPTTTF